MGLDIFKEKYDNLLNAERMIMCEECLNYKKVEKKEHESCYRNRCDGCKCKNCNDFAECDSADKKCSYCKFHSTTTTSWINTNPYTPTVRWGSGSVTSAPNGGYNVL